jgi:REP element-mobilizing transposase RayT
VSTLQYPDLRGDMSSSKGIEHRNSQKRIYEEWVEYFITSVTYERYPYFQEPILAELFIRDLWFAKELKQFDLFGHTVMPEHFHLLLQPKGSLNYSEIMGSLKRNVTRDINNIIEDKSFVRDLHVGDDSNRRLRISYDITKRKHPHLQFDTFVTHFLALEHLRRKFKEQYQSQSRSIAFRWQKSFRDHLIRDQEDYLNHLEYICNNAIKHGLVAQAEHYPFTWIVGMEQPFAPD